MLELDIKYFEVGDSGLCCSVDGVPTFESLGTVSFPKESLEQVVRDYLDDNWGNGYDTENTVAFWLNDENKNHWFDIKKDDNGDYYYIAGDQTGIVYFEQIAKIKVIYDDYEVWFNEDSDFYYIMFLDKDGEYNKRDWTLENAIQDMERVLEDS